MTIKTFIRLPVVRMSIHLILLIGIAFNVVQFFRISHLQNQVEEEQLVLQLLEETNNESKNKKDYYNSELYREVYAKQKLYKVRDERVLDSSSIEGDNEELSGEYIPQIEVDESRPNYVKWFEFFTQYD